MGALVAVASGAALAGSAGQETVASGSNLYRTYCQSCHGASGRGNGAVAVFLRVPPANLTQIAKRNRGTFPADQVARAIDGRQQVRTHGDSQMPIWGDAFSRATVGSDEEAVREKIRALVDYLATIQEKAAN
jgi:mono/diheme cytochrome c family protein